MEEEWSPFTVPFRVGSTEWSFIMGAMAILGLVLLIVLAGSLYAVLAEFRTHSRLTRRDLWVTAVTASVVTTVFFWSPDHFYAVPFLIVAALAPGLSSFLAANHPTTVGLLPAVLASVLPLGGLFGMWTRCQCPLVFLVADPVGLVILDVVPTLSVGMLSYTAGLGARRLFADRDGGMT